MGGDGGWPVVSNKILNPKEMSISSSDEEHVTSTNIFKPMSNDTDDVKIETMVDKIIKLAESEQTEFPKIPTETSSKETFNSNGSQIDNFSKRKSINDDRSPRTKIPRSNMRLRKKKTTTTKQSKPLRTEISVSPVSQLKSVKKLTVESQNIAKIETAAKLYQTSPENIEARLSYHERNAK